MAERSELRQHFHEELADLEKTLMEEGELTVRMIRGALNALVHQDIELADEVIAFDDQVDEHCLDIEQRIESLLARQAPVAGELRLLLAILHINIHLERMADLSVNIAKLTKLGQKYDPDERLVQAFEEMGSRAEEMTRIALDAFRRRDIRDAESLPELDELVDRTNRQILQHVLTNDPELAEWGTTMIVAARCFERVADNAVDIGERTAYLVTGELREFTDASHPTADV